MASEKSCQKSPESPRLCANGCGFFGTPATLNLCSKCYRDHCRKAESEKIAASELDLGSPVEPEVPETAKEPAKAAISEVLEAPDEKTAALPEKAVEGKAEDDGGAAPAPAPAKERCGQCKKRVGLLKGFKCRCGTVYCTEHRYPEKHKCTFDYKAAAKSIIAKANPVVKPDKLTNRV